MKHRKLVFSAMFIAIGIILPFFTAQIKEIGDTLLPMHIPVLLSGFICGPWYGLACGFITPLLRSLLFSMPPLYPSAVWMACELATYGFVSGFLFRKRTDAGVGYLYFCLITAMLCGRVVWGVVKTILLGLGGKAFTFGAFLTGGFIDAVPGIILQLILIPAIITVLKKNNRI